MLTDSYTSLWSPSFPDNLLFHRSVIGSCSILQTDGTTLPISMLANLVNVEMTFSPALVLHRKICDWDLSSWNYTQLCKQLCKPRAQCCIFLQYQKFTCTHKIISATHKTIKAGEADTTIIMWPARIIEGIESVLLWCTAHTWQVNKQSVHVCYQIHYIVVYFILYKILYYIILYCDMIL